jgi:integrase
MSKMANEKKAPSNLNKKVKLTQNVAKKAEPSNKTRWFRDSEIPGFALRIEKTGSKSWVFEYRHKPSGKYKRHTIGEFYPGDPDNANDARTIAYNLRKNLWVGKYPTNLSEAKTVKEIVERYLKNKQRKRNSGAHYWCERVILPYAGDLTLDELDKHMVREIRDNEIAIKESENAAGFFVLYLKSCWNNALEYGYTKLTNPCIGVKGVAKRVDKNAMTEKSYCAFWRALNSLSNHTGCNPFTTLALELLALTGNRRDEIAKIQIEHINLEKREIVIPEHKNSHRDTESGDPLYIHYKKGSPIDNIIQKSRRMRFDRGITIEKSPFIFPSLDQYGNVRSSTIYRGMEWQWRKMQEAEPILKDFRIKDLRSGWISFGVNTLNIKKSVIAKANGREDVILMDKHYVADPEIEEADAAHDSVASAIAKLGDGS